VKSYEPRHDERRVRISLHTCCIGITQKHPRTRRLARSELWRVRVTKNSFAFTITYCTASVIFLARERKKRATKAKPGHGHTCPLPACTMLHWRWELSPHTVRVPSQAQCSCRAISCSLANFSLSSVVKLEVLHTVCSLHLHSERRAMMQMHRILVLK
jgi:hypothetical protein